MATESELIEALKAADKAGNADDARFLATALQDLRTQQNKTAAPQAPAEESEPASKMGFLNKGMAEVLGAPVDLIAGGMSKVTGGRVPADSFGGSESIRRGMQKIGAPTPDREPETMGESVFAVGGEVAGFAVPAAALARRFRGAQGVGGNLARSMDDALVKAPVTTTAIEAGGAAGAGVGRQLAQENELGPGGQLTAEVVGGLGGSAAGARTLASMAGDTGRRVLRQIFPNAEREASMRIQSLVQDPQAAAKAIEDLKGTNLLPSSRTQEPGLMALERTVLEQDPAFAADVARRSSETMESLVNSIRQSGSVQNARKFIEAKRNRLSAALDARIEKASQQAAKALEEVGEDATTAELGTVVRQRLDEALADAKVQEQMLWQAVPQNTKVPVSSTLKKFKELDKALAQAQADDMPAVANQLMRGRKGIKAIQLSEMDGLYKKLGEVSRIARRDGNRNQARIAEELRESILDDIGNAKGSPEVMEALQTARGFSRQTMERFRKGPVGKLLATDATGAPMVPPELTLDRSAGLSGNRGRLAAEAVAGAADDPQALEAIQGFIKRRFNDAAVTDGRVAPDRAEAFMRQNQPLLESFPALRDQLRAARSTEDVARRVEKSSDALRKRFQKETVSDAARFLGAPVDQEVNRIFRAPDPEKMMGEISKMARKDRSGKALEGLKAGVTDYIIDRATVGGIDNFGRNPVSGKAIVRMLDDPKQRKVLSKIYDPLELRRMRRSADMLAAVENSVKSKGTLENIVEPGMGATLSIPMRVIGAKLGAKFVGGGGAGVNLQAAQIGSSRMNRIWNSLTVGKAERIVAEAIKDPEVMKHLLLDFSKATPGQIRANERFFRNWGLSRALGLFDDEEE